mgnify:FL=1
MTVYKTFLKVLNKSKVPIIMYTVFLIIFGSLSFSNNSTAMDFTASKPDIVIVNDDEEVGITKNLIDYLKENTDVRDIKDENAINDALFYRDVNYVIYIPKNYQNDFLTGNNPEIKIKSTKDYYSSLADIILNRYLTVANAYRETYSNESIIIEKINNSLNTSTKVDIKSKIDTNTLSKATRYYDFLNYSMMAGAIYVICLVLSSFHEEKVKKRIIVSSMDYKKQNNILLFANSIFAIIVWLVYVILSIVLCGDVILSSRGLIYILNSFIFTICCVTIAFLISNLINNKNAINGIINVVALGSSFLCGAFVPVEFLPDSVIKIAHLLPSYWYINSNELIKTLEVVNLDTLKPIIVNMLVILLFSLIFIIISNIVTKKKNRY